MQSELTLYSYFRSSTSYRVRIALEYKQLSYTYKAVHLINNGGEQNSEDYRRLNPIGGVPTLLHGDRTVSQSFAILDYLEASFQNSPRLYTDDIFINSKIRQFCENINADIHPLMNLKVMQYLEKNLNASEEQKNIWIRKWVTDGLQACEKIVTPFAGTYCFGAQFTAADVFLVPMFFSAKRFNVDTTQFKKMSEINEFCLNLDFVKRAHPLNQPDTPAIS